jgi:anti-anti-sigma factor
MPDSGIPDDISSVPAEFLRVEATGDRQTVIAVEGELDASATGWFGTLVSNVLENHPETIAIDAGGLSFMDSSGLRCSLRARAAVIEAGVAFRSARRRPCFGTWLSAPGSGACS